MSTRAFVALELPDEVAGALAAWTPRDDALRPVAPEALHVTLAFLGSLEQPSVAAAGEALAGLGRPVAALATGPARWLPPRRPRVLAVELADGDGALAALQADVVAALAGAIGFVPERRPFLAHVTVGRVRSGARAPRVALDGVPALAFAAPAVTLFRSLLGRGGARYEPLVRVALR